MEKQKSIDFGPLPAPKINKALDLEIENGNVVFSTNAQRHARRRHEHEYDEFFPYIINAIQNPMFIGDDFRNHGKIELVTRIPHKEIGLLVAVNLEMDKNGNYRISSFYPVSYDKIKNRLLNRKLFRVI